MAPGEQPECMRCRHFYVTWDRDHPRGCRAYGFKSQALPSAVVLQESGIPCKLFEGRPAAAAPPERE